MILFVSCIFATEIEPNKSRKRSYDSARDDSPLTIS